jgi:Protein of unknown function (DUF3800)
LSCLHISLDESGDFNFSPSGSRFYSFAVAWTIEPLLLAQAITSLRFSLIKAGCDLQSFHAAEDRQHHRNLFIQTAISFDNWRFASLIVEKAKVNPSIRAPERFYPQFLASMLRFVFRGSIGKGGTSLIAFTDTLPIKRNRESVVKSIKQSCRAELGHIPFDIFHHRRESNAWIQVADYCTWSVFRKWETGDTRSYDQLAVRLQTTELDCLRYGTTRYY